MSKQRPSLIVLLVLQAVAVIVYPPAFFEDAPQAAVLPPIFLILLVAAAAAMNIGTLPPLSGRISLVFIQGINLVVRLMMLLPHLRTDSGTWNIPMLLAQILGLALSWYTITEMEKRPLKSLLLRPQEAWSD